MGNVKPSIFIVLLERFSIRNFLLSPIRRLLSDNKDFNFIFILPIKKSKLFSAHYEENLEQVVIKPPNKKGLKNRLIVMFFTFLEDLLFYRFQKRWMFKGFRVRLQAMRKSKIQAYSGKNNTAEYIKYISYTFFGGRSKWLFDLIYRFYKSVFVFASEEVKDLYEAYKPVLVVTNEPHQYQLREYMCEAGNRDIPVIALIHSWDNVILRGVMMPVVSHFMVWNQVTKDELTRYHNIQTKDISIVGMPHHDIGYECEKLIGREEYFKKMKIPPDRKLITFATNAWKFAKDDPDFCDWLIEKINENEFIKPCFLFIRVHPTDYRDKYKKFKNMKNVVVQYAIKHVENELAKRNFRGDEIELINLMRHSDVLINSNSTITLDAIMYDTPVINIGFDGYQNRPFYESNAWLIDREYFVKMLDCGGTQVVYRFDELFDGINRYLTEPQLHAEGRQKVRERYIEPFDGKASQRVVDTIISMAERSIENRESFRHPTD